MKAFEIENKNVVITGGASGIGFAIAKNLGAKGCKVMIAEPDEARLSSAVEVLSGEGVDACYHICDVADPEQVEQLADAAWLKFNQVDMVFNNAGIGMPQKPMVESKVEHLKAMFDVNFFGVWYGCQAFGKRFIAQGTPAGIYNTGSENSLFNAVPNNAGYLAAKHAVLGLTENLREQMPDFINVGLIIPGFVKTGLTARVGNLAMDADEYAGIVVRQVEEGRFFIVSHGYNMVHIQDRYDEISAAYEAHAPRYDGDEEYDIRALLSKMSPK